MPTSSQTKLSHGMTGFSTYGAPVSWTNSVTYQGNRARNWSRLFANNKAKNEFLMVNGYLPTLPYDDDLQEVVKSKVVDVYGQLNSAPNSIFEWHIIPNANRVSVDPWEGTMNTLASMVIAKLQSKISGNGTNLAVTCAELPKTFGMIGDAARSLSQAYRQARRGNFSKAARTLGLTGIPAGVSRSKSFDSNWLEYRYGWRLVVYDIDSLMKTVHDLLTTRPPVLRVTAVETRQYVQRSNQTEVFQMPNGMRAFTATGYSDVTFTKTVRGGYVYKLESVPLSAGQSFGLLNPFMFAWELIPYSFVVDWLVNVGQVLEGLTAFQGKTFLDGWISREIESSRDTYWTSVEKHSDIYSLSPGITRATIGQKERRYRRRFQSFTPVSLRVEVDIGVSRALDGIALATTRRRSMRTPGIFL